MLKRPPAAAFETIVHCGTGAEAYDVMIGFPMSSAAARVYLQDRNHPDFKGKQGEELVSEIVKRSMQSTPTMVTRLKNGVRNDGPNGEPAYAMYQTDWKLSLKEHCKDGKLNDSTTGEAAFQVYDHGMLKSATHYTTGVETLVKQYSYTDTPFQEVADTPQARETRAFNKAAADPSRDWKTCYVSVQYRNKDHFITDGPQGTPGQEVWKMGYQLVNGQPWELKFSNQAEIVSAQHYTAKGRLDKDATTMEKRILTRQPLQVI